MTRKHNVAIVVQRYGEEVSGGAELHARWLAEHLLSFANVTVLTTCAVDTQTWHNVYPTGETTLNGVRVQRFRVDRRRNWKQSVRQSKRIILEQHTYFDELAWIKAQGPESADLLTAINQQRDDFDCFIFFTYLYATTYFGMQLVPEKAILIPTAHDEPYLYLNLFRTTFNLPRLIVYNTASERAIVNAATQNQHVPSRIVGVGINMPPSADPDRFRQKYNITGDFILYVGRIDGSKNIPALLDHFLAFDATSERDVTLVLAGKAQIDLPQHARIRPIGFISEQDKFDGLAATVALVNPSKYESLSMVLLEAWLMERPTLVNSQCGVLKDQSRRSNGGLWYGGSAEFDATLTYLLDHPDQCEVLGKNGRAFVEREYAWEVVLAKFGEAFAFLENPMVQTIG